MAAKLQCMTVTIFILFGLTCAEKIKYTEDDNFGWARKVKEKRTMQSLVNELFYKGSFKTKNIEHAMLAVDRKSYCNCGWRNYDDQSVSLSNGGAIGPPSLHATALQLMKPYLKRNGRGTALDVGCGSGYMTAAMAVLMGDSGGLVVGIEHIHALAQLALKNINDGNPNLVLTKRVRVATSDGRQGFASAAPYDVIYCEAFAEEIPKAFRRQLKYGGRILMGIGKPGEISQLVTADLEVDGSWTYRNVTEVWLQPLTDPTRQLGD